MGLLLALYGVGALVSPLVATEFSTLPHWSYHYFISFGGTIVNLIVICLVFRFQRMEGSCFSSKGAHMISRLIMILISHSAQSWADRRLLIARTGHGKRPPALIRTRICVNVGHTIAASIQCPWLGLASPLRMATSIRLQCYSSTESCQCGRHMGSHAPYHRVHGPLRPPIL